MMRILIADDHPVVRRGLRDLLEEEPGVQEVAEADSGTAVLNRIRTKDYDLVILDISMPGMAGLELLKELRAQRPRMPVIVLSVHPEEQYAVRALRAGAAGYLTKDAPPEELLKAVRKALAGGKYVSPTLAETLAFSLEQGGAAAPHERLSDREYEVMCLLARGKTPTEIAQQLHLSVKTVSTYRTRILEKMEMHSNAELVRYAIQNGIVG